jgi:predicted enzyme related to lactoylglutathione lyase
MPERDRYIPGVPSWVDTSQPDPQGALAFYGGLFGWEFEEAMPEDSGAHYFMALIRSRPVAAIGSIPDGAPPEPTWNTYVTVASADDAAATAERAGGTVVMPAFDVMSAGRMVVIADPEGAVFNVWEARDSIGAEIVNEHGSLNFNGLATRDVDRARDFYGTVFGWTTLSIPAGTFWRLPPYGDHLEERSPGLHEQMAQMGAPDGFVDVVAAVEPVPPGDTATPAHWTVTFAVDDVDAAATAAARLGAEVLDGPVDAPWTRRAVIRDPQGATFVASQFVAENAGLTA